MIEFGSASPAVPQEQIFTGSGSFVVPAGVSVVQVKMTGGGGGGGGGHATGGGGGGGGGSPETAWLDLPVTPGSTLTVTVGAAGALGAIGANGGDGGLSSVTGGLVVLPTSGFGSLAFAGGAANGGNSGRPVWDATSCVVQTGVSGGAAAGGASAQFTSGGTNPMAYACTGGAGAGTGSGGGGGSRSFLATAVIAGGANIGGGAGGCTAYGNGGVGGATSVAGTAAASTAYGAGGGGGGQNAAGAAGAPGLVRIRWWR